MSKLKDVMKDEQKDLAEKLFDLKNYYTIFLLEIGTKYLSFYPDLDVNEFVNAIIPSADFVKFSLKLRSNHIAELKKKKNPSYVIKKSSTVLQSGGQQKNNEKRRQEFFDKLLIEQNSQINRVQQNVRGDPESVKFQPKLVNDPIKRIKILGRVPPSNPNSHEYSAVTSSPNKKQNSGEKWTNDYNFGINLQNLINDKTYVNPMKSCENDIDKKMKRLMEKYGKPSKI